MSQTQVNKFEEILKLLQDLNAHSVKFEEGQAELVKTVNVIKRNQETLENKIPEISGRLLSVEAKTDAFEKFEEELILNQELIRSAKRENANLRARFDGYEDTSSRDNLFFTVYQIPHQKIGQ